jgi:hypothetical protein
MFSDVLRKLVDFILRKLQKFLRTAVGDYARETATVEWERFRGTVHSWVDNLPRPLARFKNWQQKRERELLAAAELRLYKVLPPLEFAISDLEPASKAKAKELTFPDLYRKVNPPSPEWLARKAPNALRAAGWHYAFRVRSPISRSFYQDFESLGEIPNELTDTKANETFTVTPGLVTAVFKGY